MTTNKAKIIVVGRAEWKDSLTDDVPALTLTQCYELTTFADRVKVDSGLRILAIAAAFDIYEV